jgi:tight adherence protein B
MRDALYHLMDRVDDPNLPILVIGVLITQEVGGNLAEVLNNTTHTIRERFKLMREVRVMTAQGRLSGLVLTSLPFLVAGALFFLNPLYFMVMIERSAGHWMLAYALASLLIGHLVIRRIIQIKV